MRTLFLAMLLVGAVRVGAVSVTAVRCPDGGVQPQAAVDSSGKIHLIYLKGEDGACDVFYVSSTDGGKTWSKAMRVNSQPGAAIATGTVRGAQMAIGKGNRVHVAWMGSSVAQPKAPGDGTPMLYARMNDAGDAFEAQRNVITKAAGLDGGGSVAADPDSNQVAVIWHAPMPGERGEENRSVYCAFSGDAGKTFEPEQNALSERTGACGCCGMRAMFARKTLVFLYRNVSGDDRSMLLRAMLFDGVADHPLSGRWLEDWRTKSCPMSTAALARSGKGMLAAWETQGQVQFEAIEVDGLAPSSAAIPAPGKGSNRKHPTLAVNKNGEVLMAWSEGTGWKRGGTIHWQLYDKSFKPVANGGGMQKGLAAWSLPTAVAREDGSFVVVY
jgi:hypothetical protein